jgi:hypothetical protein
LLFIICPGFRLYAQTTIGDGEPAKAALLQIKDKEPATGGLLLPRVELNTLDDFLLAGLTPDQERNHTGLLVYNVKEDTTSQLEKGIYQWNGTEWQKLKKISKTEGVSEKKLIYRGTQADENGILSLGEFEFRMTTELKKSVQHNYPQLRLSSPGQKTYYWQISEYFDNIVDSNGDMKDEWPTTTGGSVGFYCQVRTVKMTDAFVNCNSVNRMLSNLERNEMWLADIDHDNMYHVQFMVLGNNDKDAQKTYIIIAQKY